MDVPGVSLKARNLYRSADVALLRAATVPISQGPGRWPMLEDAEDCRDWLAQVWPGSAEAIGLASSELAARVEQVLDGRRVPDRQVCSLTVTVVRYLVRSAGRPTPFALFAGVAPVRFGQSTSLRFGSAHRTVSRADAAWLSEIIDELEAGPALMCLDAAFNSLAFERAGQLVVPRAEGRAEIALTGPVAVVRDAARDPVRLVEVADILAAKFPQVPRDRVEALLRGLVTEKFLITSLRAPMTCVDPLDYLVGALQATSPAEIPEVVAVLKRLEQIRDAIAALNAAVDIKHQARPRASLVAEMNRIRPQVRSPIAVDLLLDCETHLPESVADDMAAAAGILTRLGPAPLGPAVWADYHRCFVERYGIGTVVPLGDVIDLAAGLGYPAGYPRSVLPKPVETVTERDRRLLALAWQALAEDRPLELTDAAIDHITSGDVFDARFIQPHVEIAARIRARSVAAVNAGDYLLVTSPARSAGTLTARFQQITGDATMARIYRSVPVMQQDAHPVQLSCPPLFVRGQNVARLPVFLQEVIAIGEPPSPAGTDQSVRTLRELSLTATGRGLLLLETASGRILEPQVFHALALERQMPPLARFLAHLPRAFAASFSHLDFGPAATALPHLPEVRCGRIILAAERWRLVVSDAPKPGAGQLAWRDDLDAWCERHRCPDLVDLADGDMMLRLDLSVGAHAAILRKYLADHGSATLTRATPIDEFGWIGHAHEVVLPVFRAGSAAPSKLGSVTTLRRNADGHRPMDPDARWISARIHTHPDAMDHVIAAHLPRLRQAVGVPLWMLRYRSLDQTDHLRIRLDAGSGGHGQIAAALGAWAAELASAGMAGPVVFDTYFPEAGRYGTGPALVAAEVVFCADTTAAIIALQQPPPAMSPDTLTALSMIDIAEAFLGSMDAATVYLTSRNLPAQTIDHDVVSSMTRLARLGVPRMLPHLASELTAAWVTRAEALAAYRNELPSGCDVDTIATSLLHLHYNRHRGIDKEKEARCVRLARSATLAWRAVSSQGQPGPRQ